MKTKLTIATIVLAIVIILAIIASYALRHTEHKQVPIKQVIISGDLQKINQQELIMLLKPLVQHKDFFDANLEAMSSAAQSMPWISQAEVSRVWPNSIAVHIVPEQAMAEWNQKALVNAYGELFYPKEILLNQQLPQVVASGNASPLQVLSYYQQMSDILKPVALKISQVNLDSSNSWQLTLTNGMNLQLGKQNVLTRLRRFVKVYNKVFIAKHKQAKSVDLRYAHGMAVDWQ